MQILIILCTDENDEEWGGVDDAWEDVDDAGIELASSVLPPATDGYEIEYFPGTEAAAPINTPVAGRSTFAIYQQQLNDDNMYAPFASKKDWEVAKWAKLHGPSSCAFDELLQIDGVSQLICCKILD